MENISCMGPKEIGKLLGMGRRKPGCKKGSQGMVRKKTKGKWVNRTRRNK